MNIFRYISLGVLCFAFHAGGEEVTLIRVPNQGIQPRAAVGTDGTLHLVYFKGNPAEGSLFYVKRPPGENVFSEPVRVNQQDGAAIAMGTIRGAQIALGRNDRVHVSWMGSGKVSTGTSEAGHPLNPMLYTRLNNAGTGFEPERNVMSWTSGLDGGGSVAADTAGNVYVAWHGRAPDSAEGEAGRAVFVARSADDGQTFERERQANPEPTGTCACCGMRAFCDNEGRLHLLYRAANDLSRDMMLLTSVDDGKTFEIRQVNRWFTQTCPMSSAVMASSDAGLILATESAGQVQLNQFRPDAGGVSEGQAVANVNAKHPALALDGDGHILAAWAEGAGWAKGGKLQWSLFDASGARTGMVQEEGSLPEWSFPAVIYQPESGFAILY